MFTPVKPGMKGIKHTLEHFNPSLLDTSNNSNMQRSILIIAICLTAAAMVNLYFFVEKTKYVLNSAGLGTAFFSVPFFSVL